MQFLDSLDLVQNELQNAVLQNLASAPGSPKAGQWYFDTTLGKAGVYQGGAWVYISTSVTNGVTKTSAAGSSGIMQVSGGADRTIADYTGGAGLVKSNASGVISAASAGTDYTTPSGTESLTNKTINASSNTVTNITTAMFATNVIDTDTTLAANSDTRIASQKATKAYIDGKVTSGFTYKGSLDCSTNPNYPSGTVGDMYKVSVAGKIGGASGQVVGIGDTITCIINNAGGTDASVGADWDITQANVDQATTSTLGLVALADQTTAEAKTDSNKALTASSVVNFSIKKTFTIGDGTSTSIDCTHNLGTKDVIVQARDSSDNVVMVNIQNATTAKVTLTFATAPTLNSIKVVVIG